MFIVLTLVFISAYLLGAFTYSILINKAKNDIEAVKASIEALLKREIATIKSKIKGK